VARRSVTGDLFVWVGLTVLAVIFAVLGPMKLDPARFATRRATAWARDLPPTTVRGIGVLETLAAVALVWPLATRTLPWLSPLASACLTVLMACAALFHRRRGERDLTALCVVLGLLAAAVTVGILS